MGARADLGRDRELFMSISRRLSTQALDLAEITFAVAEDVVSSSHDPRADRSAAALGRVSRIIEPVFEIASELAAHLMIRAEAAARDRRPLATADLSSLDAPIVRLLTLKIPVDNADLVFDALCRQYGVPLTGTDEEGNEITFDKEDQARQALINNAVSEKAAREAVARAQSELTRPSTSCWKASQPTRPRTPRGTTTDPSLVSRRAVTQRPPLPVDVLDRTWDVWGSVADWVSGLATFFTLLWAVIIFSRQVEDSRRDQASKVIVTIFSVVPG